MAKSEAHKFGQLIGEIIESILIPYLESFCSKNFLYLDYQKKNRTARKGKKVTWVDEYGNKHDLDFVIERNGSDEYIGKPVAFIESAWRRYTKHSRNKAQEIQGAILPLSDKYDWNKPFLGVILAGLFTEGSLEQLHSLGFSVLHFPYNTILSAFASESLDIAFTEDTPDDSFKNVNEQILNLEPDILERIKQNIVHENKIDIDRFFSALNEKIKRQVSKVILIPLYGRENEFISVNAAIRFLESHSIYEGSGDFRRYEIQVNYSNGDQIHASFEMKEKVVEFLTFISQ